MTTTFSIGSGGSVNVASQDFKSLDPTDLTAFDTAEGKGIAKRVKQRMAVQYKREYDAAMARINPEKVIKDRLTAKRAAIVSSQGLIDDFIKAEMDAGKTADEAEAIAMRFASALSYAGELNTEIAAPSGTSNVAWDVYMGGRGGGARKAAPKRKKGKGKRK